MARYVPGRFVVDPPPARVPGGAWRQVSPRPKRRWQPGHWADERGNWIADPRKTVTKKTTTIKTGGLLDRPGDYTPGSYSGGLSDAEIERRANALADAQLAASSAAIERTRAAAAAQAARDVATQQALGGAQMGMISQIPQNIQAIRNTAAQAIASTAGQVAGAQAQQGLAERAANATFAASQGQAPAPAADGAGGPVPNGPGPGAAIGVDPTASAAAVEAMGGTIPAQNEIAEGAASAIAVSGMPAVVARATQDQVAMRMSQAAMEDAGYRQELIDLASTRGGIYMDAVSNLYDLENQKYGRWEAEERRKQDAYELRYKAWSDQQEREFQEREFKLKTRAQTAAEKLAAGEAVYKKWLQGQKLSQDERRIAQADKRIKLESQRVTQGWTRLELQNKSQQSALQTAVNKGHRPNPSLSRAYGYIVDSNGTAILDGKGHRIQVAKSAGKPGGGPTGGVSRANEMAKDFRGSPPRKKDPITGTEKVVPPRVSYQSAYKQIYAELIDRGYTKADAQRIARGAVNAAYGPGVGGRPKTG